MISLAAGLLSRARRWWRNNVIDDTPHDDDWMRWQHWTHCTDPHCPCQQHGTPDAC